MILYKIINEEIGSFLNEKLANVDSDVDYLYNEYFANSINYFNKTGEFDFKEYNIDTSVLKSEDAVMANSINPSSITINNYNSKYSNANFYDPFNSSISIGLNKGAIDFVKDNGNLENAIRVLYDMDDPQNATLLQLEFTEEKIKGSIHHELAHWIDDSLHNHHIRSDLKKREKLIKNKKPVSNVNTTKFEIEGQIHNIKQLKNKFNNIWNMMTFDDLINKTPTLKSIYNSLSYDDKIKWIKDLKNRMYREGLLGEKMYNN